jgi:hypothetical protein
MMLIITITVVNLIIITIIIIPIITIQWIGWEMVIIMIVTKRATAK